MKALLKSGKWAEIDTRYLFHNQYNTIEGKRIFDSEILRVVDDVRGEYGKCRYCGAIIRRGEEEKHFKERENAGCINCFWCFDRVTDRQTTTEIEMYNNERVRVRKTIEKLEKACRYAENLPETSGCSLKECRRMGIDWFTPENTFFLKFPDGFSPLPVIDCLGAAGFSVESRFLNATYHKKIGSYTLQAILVYTDGKPYGVECFRLYNSRIDYRFMPAVDGLYIKSESTWKKVRTFRGVPDSVMKNVRKIVMDVTA